MDEFMIITATIYTVNNGTLQIKFDKAAVNENIWTFYQGERIVSIFNLKNIAGMQLEYSNEPANTQVSNPTYTVDE